MRVTRPKQTTDPKPKKLTLTGAPELGVFRLAALATPKGYTLVGIRRTATRAVCTYWPISGASVATKEG